MQAAQIQIRDIEAELQSGQTAKRYMLFGSKMSANELGFLLMSKDTIEELIEAESEPGDYMHHYTIMDRQTGAMVSVPDTVFNPDC